MSKKVELSAEERAQLVLRLLRKEEPAASIARRAGYFRGDAIPLARGAHQSPSQGLRVRTLGGASASRIAPADSGPDPDLGT